MATFTVNLIMQVTAEGEADDDDLRDAAFAEAAAKLQSRGLSCLHIESVEKEEPQTCFEVELITTLVVAASSPQEAEELALKVAVEDIQQDNAHLVVGSVREVPCFAQVPD